MMPRKRKHNSSQSYRHIYGVLSENARGFSVEYPNFFKFWRQMRLGWIDTIVLNGKGMPDIDDTPDVVFVMRKTRNAIAHIPYFVLKPSILSSKNKRVITFVNRELTGAIKNIFRGLAFRYVEMLTIEVTKNSSLHDYFVTHLGFQNDQYLTMFKTEESKIVLSYKINE